MQCIMQEGQQFGFDHLPSRGFDPQLPSLDQHQLQILAFARAYSRRKRLRSRLEFVILDFELDSTKGLSSSKSIFTNSRRLLRLLRRPQARAKARVWS